MPIRPERALHESSGFMHVQNNVSWPIFAELHNENHVEAS